MERLFFEIHLVKFNKRSQILPQQLLLGWAHKKLKCYFLMTSGGLYKSFHGTTCCCCLRQKKFICWCQKRIINKQGILFERDTPIFCTSEEYISFVRGEVLDKRETQMMRERFAVFLSTLKYSSKSKLLRHRVSASDFLGKHDNAIKLFRIVLVTRNRPF